MKSLLNYCNNIHSQHGEDGILQEILSRLNILTGEFVEFGAWDGVFMSNTYNLCENKNWNGVYIECDPIKFEDLKKTQSKHPNNLQIINALVSENGPNSLDMLLDKIHIKKDFEILSIDIDSIDFFIWKSFKNYNPIIVIIECNSSIPLGTHHTHTEKINGSSFTSIKELGIEKGYSLVCHTGNSIFVRNDYIHKLKLSDEELNNSDCLFRSHWVNPNWNL